MIHDYVIVQGHLVRTHEAYRCVCVCVCACIGNFAVKISLWELILILNHMIYEKLRKIPCSVYATETVSKLPKKTSSEIIQIEADSSHKDYHRKQR